MKPAHIPTLIKLLLLGAATRPVQLSTTSLAREIGKSQQVASKHLMELEAIGYIERITRGSRSHVRLTHRGIQELTTLHTALNRALEEMPAKVEITGELFTGLKEGAYYVSLRGYRRQFISKLGFDPYPGTLNLRLITPMDRQLRKGLMQEPGILIEGFENQTRSYGWVRFLPAQIGDSTSCAVFSSFERTHYDETVLEILAPVNLRQTLGLKDGDTISVRVFLGSQPVKTR